MTQNETPPRPTSSPKLSSEQVATADPEGLSPTLPGISPTLPSVNSGPEAPRSAPPPPGTKIGRYILLRLLGEGGMGVVYVAHDPELDRQVALKLLRSELSDGPHGTMGRDRLVREAHAMAKLNHPQVVAIYDSGIFESQVFLAMELVDGWNVRTWLATPRSRREIVEVFLKAGRGLAAAHAAGLVHRDFKGDNVLVGRNGEVKVLDFGLARAATDLEPRPASQFVPEDLSLSKQLTQVGAISGTPGYIAPEQLRGHPADARSDEFSFCVALYEALYRERPFREDFVTEHSLLRPPPTGTPIPPWLRTVLLRGLAVKPEDRFPDLPALLEALADDPAVRRRRLLKVGGGVAIAALAVATLALIEHRRDLADRCYAPETQLKGVWDDTVRDRVRAAFAAAGVAEATTSVAYAEKAVDQAAAAWLSTYLEACEATRVRHIQPEAALNLRLDCLAEQRLDLQAAAEIMSVPKTSAQELAAATGPIFALPVPTECADAHRLALLDPPPPERVHAIETLRLSLARGRALRAAAKYADAVKLLKPLPEEAAALGNVPLQSQALYELGRATAFAGDPHGAMAQLTQAEALAVTGRLDTLATQAAAAMVIRELFSGGSNAEIDTWMGMAAQDLRRAGAGGIAEYRVEEAIQLVESSRGRHAEAIVHGRRALAVDEKLFGTERAQMSSVGLATDLEALGRYDESLPLRRQTRLAFDSVLGPTNQSGDMLTNLLDLGISLYYLGHLEEARETLDNLFARVRTADRIDAAVGRALRATIESAEGKRAESAQSVAQAIEMATRLHQLTDANSHELPQFVIEADLRDGEPQLALEAYAKYLVPLIAQQDLPADSPDWVEFLRIGGWVYLDAGQPAQALPILDRALALSAAHPFYPGWVPRLRYQVAKALVLTRGDRSRAEALAQQAHDELAGLAAPDQVSKALLLEIDAWRTTAFHP